MSLRPITARLAATAGAVVLVVALPSSSQADGETTSTVTPRPGDAAIELNAELKSEIADAEGSETAAVNSEPPEYLFAKVPACAGNDIDAGVDIPCQEAAEACPDPEAYQWWLYRGAVGLTIGEPGWTRVGTICSTPDALGTDPTTPGFTLADFQRLPLPAGESTVQPPGESTVQPPGAYVLIREPTIVYATAGEPALFDTALAGLPIQVRATAARWSWDFGDGAMVGPTSDPGAPWPALRNHHAYTERGTFSITMTTHYTGEYSVAGGPWLPVPGEATVTGAPTTRQVLAGKAKLVDVPCPAYGCPDD